ncbi:hypothetical protein [Mycobacterium marseillense]|uniref:hypothetical protein n=1 Tax=Mycobacterium marseillense TaxID=701042 RepID=UPI0011A65142|nr:hypothetical protein [Mycobacterium marseillense]
MADGTVIAAAVTGASSMVVAIVGIGSVLLTQKRADARQGRIATANREFERDSRLIDKRRELGAEFVSAIWLLAAESIDAVPEGAQFGDLTPDETAAVRRTLSTLCMVLDPAGRKAAEAVFEALVAHVGTFTQESWDAIGDAEDGLIAAINDEFTAQAITRDDALSRVKRLVTFRRRGANPSEPPLG